MKKVILIKLLFVFSMYLSGCAGREISDYSWGSVSVCVSIGHINNRSNYYEGLEYKIFLESENQDNMWNVGDVDNDGDDDVISSGLRSIEWVSGSPSSLLRQTELTQYEWDFLRERGPSFGTKPQRSCS